MEDCDGVAFGSLTALFSVVTVAVGIPCMLVWLGFGTAMQRLLKTERALRAFNVCMGLLFAATVMMFV